MVVGCSPGQQCPTGARRANAINTTAGYEITSRSGGAGGARAARGVGGCPGRGGACHRTDGTVRPVGLPRIARPGTPLMGGARCGCGPRPGGAADDQGGTPPAGGLPGGLPARPAHRVAVMPAFGPQVIGEQRAKLPEGHPDLGRPPGTQVLQGRAEIPGGRCRQGDLIPPGLRDFGHGPGQRGVGATTATVR